METEDLTPENPTPYDRSFIEILDEEATDDQRLLEWFAGLAMQGWIRGCPHDEAMKFEAAAAYARRQAKAMMATRVIPFEEAARSKAHKDFYNLKDWYAGLAMEALLGNIPPNTVLHRFDIAESAWEQASHMMKKRQEEALEHRLTCAQGNCAGPYGNRTTDACECFCHSFDS